MYWFADDWGGTAAAASCAIDALRDAEVAAAVRARSRRAIKYFEYNWGMNRAIPREGA